MAGRNSPSDERLRRRERITDEYEYKRVIRSGRVVRSRCFKAYLLTADGLGLKAGFIAGRSVGGAVQRNRAKRLLKEAYRRLKSRLKPIGFQVVFVAGEHTAKGGAAEVEGEMVRLFEACGLLDGAR